ncbi:MAG TPA: squalene synthase HpnC [Bacteroidota bacterium]|nr:squalene synthase HpnC [Bacteroidota bacterium]
MSESLQSLAETHYENFPVGSILVAKEFRSPIRLVYAFARVADDIADEGDAPSSVRLQKLDDWEGEFRESLAGLSDVPFFIELAEAVKEYSIPSSLFIDLMAAFKMDAEGREYPTFADVLAYCSHSANPVGRIVLHIVSHANDETYRFSDSICTALQLTNFWQDLSIDIKRNRLYIPREDLERFGVTPDALRNGGTDAIAPLLKFQVERTKRFFLDGKPLFHLVDARFSFELRATFHGGMRILEKIEQLGYDTTRRRPALSIADWPLIGFRTLLTR